MKANLDTLRSEIHEYLASHGLAVFHGQPRGGDDDSLVYWDQGGHPDFRAYLAAAEAAGVRMVNVFANEFSADVLDDALEHLEESTLPREERRSIEKRFREMRAYVGFVCQIELSFDLGARVYVFELRTDWFDELNDLLYSIEDAYEDVEEEDPLGGGYFSKN